MSFNEIVNIRQSVRKYTSQPIAREAVEQCVEAARLAPSACNAQPWKFIVVDEPVLKNKIAEKISDALMNKFVFQAPVLAVIVIENPNFTSWIGAKLKHRAFPLIDIGIAAEHFCLQATELGLGSCMIGWFQEKPIRKLLDIPRGKRIGLIISLGYAPEEYPLRTKIRKPVANMSSWNRY